MRSTKAILLKEALQQLIKSYRLTGKMKEARLVKNWEQLVGGTIARHTLYIRLKKDQLFIKIDSGVLKNELHYSKGQLIDRVNEFFKEEVVKEVVLT